MNLNTLAKKITLKEGKKVNLSIAQVKEVLRIALIEFKQISIKDLVDLIKRLK